MLKPRRWVGVLIYVAAVLVALRATAQDPAAAGPAVQLSLAEALRTALTNNLDLVIARRDPQIAAQRVDVNQAKFDPVVGAHVDFTRASDDSTITDKVFNTQEDAPQDTDTWNGNVSWDDLLEFGGSYRVVLGTFRRDDTSRNVESATGIFTERTSDVTSDGLTLHYEMPLLRGLGREVNTVDVLLARSGVEASRETLKLTAIQTIQSVENAYWDLVAAQAALSVARESLKLAQDLYELNKKKVEVGTLAPIEITQAEAGMASREEGVIVAEAAVQNAEDTLRRLLAIPKGDPSWDRPLELTDRPQFEARTVDVEGSFTTAMQNRPEIATARLSLRDRELSERVARNAVRHTLNLVAELNPTQSKVDQVVAIPPNPPVSDTHADGDGRSWLIGLTYAYPLRNRQARANYAISKLDREKSELTVQSVEQDIRVDVRVAARNVESGAKRVSAAKSNTVLQRKTLEAEQKKFENGMSTSFEVLRIQTDLSNAQLSEIQAILDYTKSLADLERAQGTLLEARGLSLANPS